MRRIEIITNNRKRGGKRRVDRQASKSILDRKRAWKADGVIISSCLT